MRFSFLTIVTRWSRSTFNCYALIGQNLTGEFMRKIYAASWNLFTDSWSCQSFVSSCDFFNCFFLLDVQNEIAAIKSLIHGWFVYWIFGWEMPLLVKVGSPISDGIVFVFNLVGWVRWLKSLKLFWPYLIVFLETLKYLFSWMKIVVSVNASPRYISFVDC